MVGPSVVIAATEITSYYFSKVCGMCCVSKAASSVGSID